MRGVWSVGTTIAKSAIAFALSRVEANSDVGGLVGWNEGGQIRNNYASGSVGGVHRVGGLVGSNKGIISDSFANGQVVASGEHTRRFDWLELCTSNEAHHYGARDT